MGVHTNWMILLTPSRENKHWDLHHSTGVHLKTHIHCRKKGHQRVRLSLISCHFSQETPYKVISVNSNHSYCLSFFLFSFFFLILNFSSVWWDFKVVPNPNHHVLIWLLKIGLEGSVDSMVDSGPRFWEFTKARDPANSGWLAVGQPGGYKTSPYIYTEVVQGCRNDILGT